MKQAIVHFFQISVCSLASIVAITPISLAQVTPDNTVNTQVERNGKIDEITGGTTKGNNLFHSFEQFSIPAGNEAHFNNANAIENIFSRVTGGSISEINGLIRANGGANLFLINPKGIIFGENASLEIGGSFYGSSASSIIFPDGEFSVLDPSEESILKISVPIGLSFEDNPGDIVNNSTANNGMGLEVNSGENIALVGGNVSLNNGTVFASDGIVNLGGLSGSGIVDINDNGSLSFPQDVAKADVVVSNGSTVDVVGTGRGSININAANFEMSAGELGSSAIRAGVSANSTGARAEDITISATDDVAIDNSVVSNEVNPGAIGDAGTIKITTGSLFVTNEGQIVTSTSGFGDAGSIEVIAEDTISIDGQGLENTFTGIGSGVAGGAEGNGGEIKITTDSLSVIDGGQISVNTFGKGDAGSIGIIAEDTIFVGNESSDTITAITSSVNEDAEGNGGEININTGSLSIVNKGDISASTFSRGNAGSIEIEAKDTIAINGQSSDAFTGIRSEVSGDAEGNAGNIKTTTGSLSVTNGGQISAVNSGGGDGGSIEIIAEDTILVDGQGSNSTFISSRVDGNQGNAGDIGITTGSLSVVDGGEISAGTSGGGDGGSIEIIAEDTILVDGQGSDAFIRSGFGEGGEGNAGDISIATGSLSITDGGQINVNTFGKGDAGSIGIIAEDTIFVGNESSDTITAITSSVNEDAEGNGGEININTGSLSIVNKGDISASTFSRGNAGSIEIEAKDTIAINGQSSDAFTGIRSEVSGDAEGNAGNIKTTTGSLSVTNGGQISAVNSGGGDGGSIEIIAEDAISVDGQGSDAFIRNGVGEGIEGNAGDIGITTGSLFVINGGQISASTSSRGDGGSIEIIAEDAISVDGQGLDDPFTGIGSGVAPEAIGDAGTIKITTDSLSVTDGGQISAGTSGIGDAGSIEIKAKDTIAIDARGSNGNYTAISSVVNEKGEGNGGEININANSLSVVNGGQINTTTSGRGDGGSIEIIARDTISVDGKNSEGAVSGIGSPVLPEAQGNAGNVEITTDFLSLTNGGRIDVATFSGSNAAGNITIEAGSLNLDNGTIEASTRSETGGNVNLTIAENVILRNNSTISAEAFGNARGGNVTINAKNGFILAFPKPNNDITANANMGQGGNINITSKGVIGFEERSSTPENNTNDLDASSQVEGFDGTVQLNTIEIDIQEELGQLEETLVRTEDTIANSCLSGNISRGNFTIGGDARLPKSPDSNYSDVNFSLTGISSLPSVIDRSPTQSNYWQQNSTPTPAVKMVGTEDGRIFLVAALQKAEFLVCRS